MDNDKNKLVEIANDQIRGSFEPISDIAKELALEKYIDINRRAHPKYEVDKFIFAHIFNVDDEIKKVTSIRFLEDAIGGYMLAKTDSGLNLKDFLFDRFDLMWISEMKGKFKSREIPYTCLGPLSAIGLAKKIGLSVNDLSNATYNVVKWSLNEGYGIDFEHDFQGGGASALEITYINSLIPLLNGQKENEIRNLVKKMYFDGIEIVDGKMFRGVNNGLMKSFDPVKPGIDKPLINYVNP